MPQKIYLRIAFWLRLGLWLGVVLILLFGRTVVERELFPCLWNRLFGIRCATCGASRAVVSLLSGDLAAAIGWNPVVTLGLVPAFLLLLLSDLAVTVGNRFWKKRRLSPLEYAVSVFTGTFSKEE